ncbi:FkbM family methyltransferase [Methylocella tundrae]|uniref:Methyltransferase, FkbM family n=1 Tax=Methylocella tundrae TaxID=227605 RepID=A0A4U8YXM6_METTU|nr:FkbM family methyltransferase [Methylocella tundrae]WPP05730.1 FkbM family methyltransferase [Methylocella tundrae]VFU08221.1 Methyltransferase, FkbM family [Methylocella tundrae]
MDVKAKAIQVTSIYRASSDPIPLVLDLLRLKRSNYVAECKGFKFELKAKCGEWYTVFENLIQEDYLKHGVSLSKGDIVLDIGANFGAFTALASAKVGQTGKVIAFEPDPLIHQRLNQNINSNGLGNVITFNEAVSGKDGEMSFFVHPKSAFSTLMDSVDQRGNSGATQIKVKSRSINSIISNIDGEISLLKIDCEGSEYSILESLDKDLSFRIKQISMEVHKVPNRNEKEISVMLRKLGFTVNDTFPLTAFRGEGGRT